MALYLKDLVKKDINEMFEAIYVNNVILPINKINQLYEKKKLNIDRLKAGLIEYNNEHNTDYKIEEIIVQGSIAMGTSVSADEKNYDIDIAIVMDKEKLPEGTLASKRIISEALKKKCYNMKNEPDPTGNSITVEYEKGYHLDFALYGKKDDIYYHCGANEWEERNPKAISRWFNNKNQENNGILKETVKFIKFFCKQNTEWLMPGGLIISVLVEETLKKDYLSMTMDNILKNVINNIIGRLEYNKDVLNPTDSSKSLIKKDKDVKKIDNLYNRLKSRISKINKFLFIIKIIVF
ncbi:MAG: cyclic GMP-AMP synthase DncV-like nucleotidyltransferase [Bacilli bacterium]